ncbi:hypothetical protein Tco_0901825 [Tanacetum coccineum]
MIDKLSIIETDKVIHNVETDKVKQIVDVESSGKSADEIDKETMSFGEKQTIIKRIRICVHALKRLHLHAVQVILTLNGFAGVNSEKSLLVTTIYCNCWPNKWTFFNRSKNHSTMRSIHHIKFHSAFPRVIQVFFKHRWFVVTTREKLILISKGLHDKVVIRKITDRSSR